MRLFEVIFKHCEHIIDDVSIKDDQRSETILSKRTKGLPVHVLLSSLSSWQSPHACRCRDNGSPETPFPILWVGRRWMSFGYASVSVSPWELHHGGRDRLCRVNQLKNLKIQDFGAKIVTFWLLLIFGVKIVTFTNFFETKLGIAFFLIVLAGKLLLFPWFWRENCYF